MQPLPASAHNRALQWSFSGPPSFILPNPVLTFSVFLCISPCAPTLCAVPVSLCEMRFSSMATWCSGKWLALLNRIPIPQQVCGSFDLFLYCTCSVTLSLFYAEFVLRCAVLQHSVAASSRQHDRAARPFHGGDHHVFWCFCTRF